MSVLGKVRKGGKDAEGMRGPGLSHWWSSNLTRKEQNKVAVITGSLRVVTNYV